MAVEAGVSWVVVGTAVGTSVRALVAAVVATVVSVWLLVAVRGVVAVNAVVAAMASVTTGVAITVAESGVARWLFAPGKLGKAQAATPANRSSPKPIKKIFTVLSFLYNKAHPGTPQTFAQQSGKAPWPLALAMALSRIARSIIPIVCTSRTARLSRRLPKVSFLKKGKRVALP
jgi:hypothetical protein